MHRALYRKWRPTSFDDVVGQEQITQTLKNEVENGRCAHAYLFTGSRGTGKTTCAKILAQAVNCLSPENGNPCGKCSACLAIESGASLDVVEIDAASNTGVDNIRELRAEANFTPVDCRYRVYIIDEAHMLSAGACNALLKIMEEPPAHVIFILATTEVHKILPTIISRCQRFDFHRIASEVIVGRLKYVAGEEGISLTDEAAAFIANMADGGMRDALSVLDRCASLSEQITVESAVRSLGVASRTAILDLADTLLGENAGGALDQLAALHRTESNPERILSELTEVFRSILLLKAVQGTPAGLRCAPSEVERLSRVAEACRMEQILFLLSGLQECGERMSRTQNKQLELEMAAVKLCTPSYSRSSEAVNLRLTNLEEAIRAGVPVAPSVPAERQEKPAVSAKEETPVRPAEEAVVPAEEPSGDAVPLDCWQEILEILARKNPALYGTLIRSTAYLSGNVVLIDSEDSMFLELMRKNEMTRNSLRDAIAAQTGKRYNLGPYRGRAGGGEQLPRTSAVDALLERAKAAGVEVKE